MITNDLAIGFISGPIKTLLNIIPRKPQLKSRTLEAECIASSGIEGDAHSFPTIKPKCSVHIFSGFNCPLELNA